MIFVAVQATQLPERLPVTPRCAYAFPIACGRRFTQVAGQVSRLFLKKSHFFRYFYDLHREKDLPKAGRPDSGKKEGEGPPNEHQTEPAPEGKPAKPRNVKKEMKAETVEISHNERNGGFRSEDWQYWQSAVSPTGSRRR